MKQHIIYEVYYMQYYSSATQHIQHERLQIT